MTRTFTVEVSDEIATLLEEVALRSSAELGRVLPLEEWILYHVQMLAISNRLVHHIQPIQEEEQAAAQQRATTRINAKRDELIADASNSSPSPP